MPLNALEDLLVEELNDLYDAEKKITKALPKLAKAASSEELSEAFEEHLRQTEGHIARLEQVFDALGMKPGRKKCEGIEGLLEEGKEMMDEDGNESVKDAALIAAAQKVEHYEMAGYGCVRTWAECMGKSDVAALLQQTLDEEGAADKKLTEIAQNLNREAEQASQGYGEEENDEEVHTARHSRRSRSKAAQ